MFGYRLKLNLAGETMILVQIRSFTILLCALINIEDEQTQVEILLYLEALSMGFVRGQKTLLRCTPTHTHNTHIYPTRTPAPPARTHTTATHPTPTHPDPDTHIQHERTHLHMSVCMFLVVRVRFWSCVCVSVCVSGIVTLLRDDGCLCCVREPRESMIACGRQGPTWAREREQADEWQDHVPLVCFAVIQSCVAFTFVCSGSCVTTRLVLSLAQENNTVYLSWYWSNVAFSSFSSAVADVVVMTEDQFALLLRAVLERTRGAGDGRWKTRKVSLKAFTRMTVFEGVRTISRIGTSTSE